MVLKIRDGKSVVNTACYLAIGGTSVGRSRDLDAPPYG